jgi:primosomal protein N' (replication factor Y) (superfamily II helicase)
MSNAVFGPVSRRYPQIYPHFLWKTPEADGMTGHILRIGLATPLLRLFDYHCPDPQENGPEYAPDRGKRVIVPFGKQTRIGIITAVTDTSEVPAAKLRKAIRIIDTEPLLDATIMDLLEWATDYYRYAPGEVITAALPGLLRKGKAIDATETIWCMTEAGLNIDIATLAKRAPVQARIIEQARETPDGAGETTLSVAGKTWRAAAAKLVEKKLLERSERRIDSLGTSDHTRVQPTSTPPTPTDDQHVAINAIKAATGFSAFLLEGVTGSGKTEVYLRCIERELKNGRQSLLLVPEIGLTPQLVDRFRQRLDTKIAILHSGLSDTERLTAWRAARDSSAGVVIGTRSAVFTPLPDPGLIIIDEEHDASLKQQDGFRYSARDLAVWRARQLDIPIVLGSATPSFESLENVNTGRYTRLCLPNRPGNAHQPAVKLIDLRTQPCKDGLTEPLRLAIARHLADNGQVLLYLNRRGFAPGMLCTSCGQLVECRRCDARLVLHQHRNRLVCHHCGSEHAVPDECAHCHAPDLLPVGQGTERLEQALNELYPQHRSIRIDRDTTRRKGEIERRLELVRSGEARLLLGTQMLTKGHDFPNVTMVAIIDADQGLFGADFRSSERLAQSFIQVAGRAGRGERPGEVYIQTLFPDHPLLTTLVAEGYDQFAIQAMAERKLAGWPPYSYLTLTRAEATQRHTAFSFLEEARDLAAQLINTGRFTGVRWLGPAAAPMERRAGKYRGQLLLQAESRAQMQRFLSAWRPQLDTLKSARKARWSVDVDPAELF